MVAGRPQLRALSHLLAQPPRPVLAQEPRPVQSREFVAQALNDAVLPLQALREFLLLDSRLAKLLLELNRARDQAQALLLDRSSHAERFVALYAQPLQLLLVRRARALELRPRQQQLCGLFVEARGQRLELGV